jgi:hypothetical protein
MHPAIAARRAIGWEREAGLDEAGGTCTLQHVGVIGQVRAGGESVRRDAAAVRSPDWLKMKNPSCAAVKREEEEDWGR